jgi:hypothetical protein
MANITTPESVIFDSLPSFPPDTRLIAYRREFHVNSAILKLHSRWFRTFMDRDQGRSDSGTDRNLAFRYEYTVTGGPDGLFGLEPLHKVRCLRFIAAAGPLIMQILPKKDELTS